MVGGGGARTTVQCTVYSTMGSLPQVLGQLCEACAGLCAGPVICLGPKGGVGVGGGGGRGCAMKIHSEPELCVSSEVNNGVMRWTSTLSMHAQEIKFHEF
jgi:hypothetical protein